MGLSLLFWHPGILDFRCSHVALSYYVYLDSLRSISLIQGGRDAIGDDRPTIIMSGVVDADGRNLEKLIRDWKSWSV